MGHGEAKPRPPHNLYQTKSVPMYCLHMPLMHCLAQVSGYLALRPGLALLLAAASSTLALLD